MKAIDPHYEKYLALAEHVAELVVKVSHPDLPDAEDVWWRQDYDDFIEAYPESAPDFRITPASMQDVDGFIDITDVDACEFNIWAKGLLRNRYEAE